jgi:TonB dependent receptor/TonB-dependent Receptor Plug Domain
MLTVLALALFTAAAPMQQDPARGVIRGRVQSEPTGLPVALAVVEADNGAQNVVGMADSTGAYQLRVAAGRQTLRVRHLEHAPTQMEVLVPAGGAVDLDVMLQHRPIALAPLEVRPSWDPRADSVAVSRTVFNLLVDRRVIDDGAGLGESLSSPFITDPADAGGGVGEALYVRGAAANTQLVLLDGAPVYAPFHMGGLIDTFEPEVVGSARLYLGGAPARYDGGLSYVMDLSTRSGNGTGHSAGGMVDGVSATGRVEGPLPGGARYLASGRTVHGASISQFERMDFPYAFRDGLLRLDLPLPEGGLSATAFANHEGMRLDTLGGAQGSASWGNLAGSLRYRGRLEETDVEITLAGGRFDAVLPWRDAGRLFVISSRNDRIRAGIDVARRAGPARVFYGGSFERTLLEYEATRPETFQTLVFSQVTGVSGGVYVDAEWQPAPRVVLRGGARADGFSVDGKAVLAPRASATWLPTEHASLTVAAGRYHQYIRIPRPLPPGAVLRNFADSVRLTTLLAVAGATHLSLELDQELAPDVRLGLEGYYKRFDGLPNPQAPVYSSTSMAHNSGLDVWVRRTSGRVTGWLGYSLGWVWSDVDDAGESDRFSGRQTITAGVRGTVWRRTTLGVRFAYGSGLPYAQAGAGGSIPNGSIPSFDDNVDLETDAPLRAPMQYLRVDAEVSRTWTPRVGGRSTEVTPFVRVINGLESRDGLFYRYFDADGSGPDLSRDVLRSVATMPLMPVVGVTWRF